MGSCHRLLRLLAAYPACYSLAATPAAGCSWPAEAIAVPTEKIMDRLDAAIAAISSTCMRRLPLVKEP